MLLDIRSLILRVVVVSARGVVLLVVVADSVSAALANLYEFLISLLSWTLCCGMVHQNPVYCFLCVAYNRPGFWNPEHAFNVYFSVCT